jgi:hypothetical protein
VVVDDMTAVMESPDTLVVRVGDDIKVGSGVIGVLYHGNFVMAGRKMLGCVEVEGFSPKNAGRGWVKRHALVKLPAYRPFSARPFSVAVDSPDLFLVPGAHPVEDYGRTPFFLREGEVVDAGGSYCDADGVEWALLIFESDFRRECARHAWIRSADLRQYEYE